MLWRGTDGGRVYQLSTGGLSRARRSYLRLAVVAQVKSEPPGTPTTVQVVRDGKPLELSIVFDPQFTCPR